MDTLMEKFGSVKIVVLGDVLLDRYIVGSVERVSPEAPVPILRRSEERETLGGAGNVALNIMSLGAQARLVSVIGDDSTGKRLAASVEKNGISAFFVVDPNMVSVCKTRVLSGHQHLLRIDEEDPSFTLLPAHEKELLTGLADALDGADALIVSDYAKGCLTDDILKGAFAMAKRAGVPVLVDPKRANFSAYAGADYIKPNRKELAAATGSKCSDLNDLKNAAALVIDQTGANILVTRSEAGMSYFSAKGQEVHLSTKAIEVFDVSGAGDTVAASFMVALSAGSSVEEAMRFSNIAAGIVVGKPGTAVVSVAEISNAVRSENADKIFRGAVSWDRARELRESWRAAGLTVGFTNGCFDLIHPGHISLLHGASNACDRLIVALNTDASVARLKGLSRPVQSENARAQVIAAIAGVDLVVLFAEDTPLNLIEVLAPDVLVKGADYQETDIVGGQFVMRYGGRVERIGLIEGQSTTKLIQRFNVPETPRFARL